MAVGLLSEPKCVNHDAEGGIGRSVRHREPMIGFGLRDRLQRRHCRSGRWSARSGGTDPGASRLSVEIERPVDVELVDRRALVEQRQKGDLRGAQIGHRGLIVGLVLHALQVRADA